MARLIGVRGLLVCATTVVVWALSGRASPAEPLRLLSDLFLGPTEALDNDKERGVDVDVVRQVFAAMGHDVSIEFFSPKRAWTMIVRGEREGMLAVMRTGERERFCSFPDEPLAQARWVLFVRTADVGRLKFTSFDDLVGHDVAVVEPVPGVFEQPGVSPELWQFLREHHNMVGTAGTAESLRMLVAGHVDYAVMALPLGRRNIARMGLSGKIEPLLDRSVMNADVSVCFSKARVSPSLVDAFSRALKQFKQTEAFEAIRRKYIP